MSTQPKLTASRRSGVGRVTTTKLRNQGLIPAVIYGSSSAPEKLQLSRRDVDRLLSHAVGENILVDLEIADGDKKENRAALIQEVQHHPVTRNILHVDFRAVSMNEMITASIPVEPIGEATGVKNFGGILEQLLHEVEVECLPKDLPEVIRVDVSALNVGDALHIRQLPLAEGVTATAEPEVSVFHVAAPRVEQAAADGAPSSPEVLKEKKEDAEKK